MNIDIGPCPHLEPCPWCGSDLEAVWRKSNPRASCKSEGCFGRKMAVVNLDDPADVSAWNQRAALAQPAPVQPCKLCNGSRTVPDGEITHSEGGVPYENGPIKCVKDCPACCGQGSMVDMTPPATARDQWMYKQGWVAARDPRSTNVVDAVIVLAGHHFKLRDLLERAMRNLHKPRRPRVRWAVVRDTFGLGSTVSAALCREFGLDPDESLEEWH